MSKKGEKELESGRERDRVRVREGRKSESEEGRETE